MEKLIENIKNITDNIDTFLATTISESAISISKIVLISLIVIVCFVLFFSLGKSQELNQKLTDAKIKSQDGVVEYMKNRKKSSKLNFQYVDTMLKQNGIKFKFKWMNPLTYLATNMLISLAIGVLAMAIHPLAFIVGMVIGWNLLDLYIVYSNNSDNKEMMEDIKSAIVTLKLQTKAGLYITNALAETFTVVKNKRLKTAIQELNGDIYNNKTIEQAVNEFNDKFNNMHIDTLSTIIKQMCESGRAAQSFKDVESNLETIQTTIIESEKQKTNTQVTVVKLMIYFDIITIIMYSLINSVLGTSLIK